MKQLEAVAVQPQRSAGVALQNVELRHLRYFVAIAEAGSFTDAAERMFIAQPTLSQQLRRLEDIIGTRLLDRRREGVRLTRAGVVLLEASRAVLSLVDHGVSHTRQAAGLGRQRLRVVVSPYLPEALAVETASRLMLAAASADVDVAWLEASLDSEFSPIRERKADAGTYDAWSEVLRAADPGFAFADPPLRHSLPMSLAFAAAASRPTAVLTGPYLAMGSTGTAAGEPRMAGAYDMVEVTMAGHPLAATAGLVWNTDMPRQLQQILFDAADGVKCAPLAHAS